MKLTLLSTDCARLIVVSLRFPISTSTVTHGTRSRCRFGDTHFCCVAPLLRLVVQDAPDLVAVQDLPQFVNVTWLAHVIRVRFRRSCGTRVWLSSHRSPSKPIETRAYNVYRVPRAPCICLAPSTHASGGEPALLLYTALQIRG